MLGAVEEVRKKFEVLSRVLNERQLRLWAATEAEALGRGGVTVVKNEALVDALDALIDPVTRGDPTSPLRWTTKSLRHLAREPGEQGHQASPTMSEGSMPSGTDHPQVKVNQKRVPSRPRCAV